MILENSTCKIEVERNPKPGRANVYYDVTLISGDWPGDLKLVTACDNRSFEDDTPRHFGGSVSRNGNHALVTVYID